MRRASSDGTAGDGPSGSDAPEVRYEQLVHCPTSVDLGVLTFRRWLRTRAGGGVPWACDDVLPARGDEDIFDMRGGGWKGAGPTTRGPRPASRFLASCLPAFLHSWTPPQAQRQKGEGQPGRPAVLF